MNKKTKPIMGYNVSWVYDPTLYASIGSNGDKPSPTQSLDDMFLQRMIELFEDSLKDVSIDDMMNEGDFLGLDDLTGDFEEITDDFIFKIRLDSEMEGERIPEIENLIVNAYRKIEDELRQ